MNGFAQEAANHIGKEIGDAIRSSGTCVLCLAGGKTPLPIYRELAKAAIDWSAVYFAIGDERNVPLDSPESNFKGAYDALIAPIYAGIASPSSLALSIPESHILKIRTELGMEKAAEAYEKDLLAMQKKLGRDYLFDVMLLGIGADGHTASLFPGSPGLAVTERLVTPNIVDNAFKERITLTYPAIALSKKIIFLADASKKSVIEKVRAGADLPATKVDRFGEHDEERSGKARRKVVWIVGM